MMAGDHFPRKNVWLPAQGICKSGDFLRKDAFWVVFERRSENSGMIGDCHDFIPTKPSRSIL
jgi:hypothetical protein